MTDDLRPLIFGFAFACAFLTGGVHAAEYNGFCGNYSQVASNAGACQTCKLIIAGNPQIQKYFVEANNG